MLQKEMTCILCPMGCRLSVEQDGEEVRVTGNTCKRGAEYGRQELLNPMRVVTTSVRVTQGARRICPVKTRGAVPKASIPAVLELARNAQIAAPLSIGQVVLSNVAGSGVDLVATAKVNGINN